MGCEGGVTLTYPSGRTIQYGYAAQSDVLESVTSLKDGSPTVLATEISHEPFGPLDSAIYGNGTRLIHEYENLAYRLQSVGLNDAVGGNIRAQDYNYDPAGNVDVLTKRLPTGDIGHLLDYDILDHLTGWSKPGRAQTITYDLNGNRQTFADEGLYTTYSYHPSAPNLLTGSTGMPALSYEHDAVGNIIGWGAKVLSYEINGRLLQVQDNGSPVGEYLSNVDGQRVKKIAGGQETYFEYDLAGRLIHESRLGDNMSVDYVYLDGAPLAMLISDGSSGIESVVPMAGPHGSISPSTPQTVGTGQTVTFTLAADTGYHVGSVTGCGGTLNESTYTTAPVTGDCTVTASFDVNSYTVMPAPGENGSIAPSSPQAVTHGQTASFTVTPNTGYHIAGVSGCGGTLNGLAYTTGPITENCTVSATFVIESYGLWISKSGTGSGTVTSSPLGISCGSACNANYDYGTVVTLTQTPASGSVFAGWSGGGCSGTGNCAVTMSGDQNTTAAYDQGIRVTAPNGGESWQRNKTKTITWAYLGSPGADVKIELLKAGAVNKTIVSSASIGSGGSGSYSWKVPNNQTTGADYQIRITSTTVSAYTDTSDSYFTIY